MIWFSDKELFALYGIARLASEEIALDAAEKLLDEMGDRGLVWSGDRYFASMDINCQLSEEEGWGLFEGDSGFHLEQDNDVGLLADCHAAWRLVVQRASYGSALHIRALSFMRSGTGSSWDDIVGYLGRDPLAQVKG